MDDHPFCRRFCGADAADALVASVLYQTLQIREILAAYDVLCADTLDFPWSESVSKVHMGWDAHDNEDRNNRYR